jgi:Alpha/beta hydrolase domain
MARSYTSVTFLIGLVAFAGVAGTIPAARAEIADVKVVAAREIGPFGGKNYRELQAELSGRAPGGPYRVPVTLLAPSDPAQHSDMAIVDVVNTVTIGKDQWVLGGRPFPLARIHMGDAFLLRMGNVYVDAMWDKAAVEALGNGSIATGADGYAIIADIAALAREPGRFIRGSSELPASRSVVAYGYSQSGSLLRGWFYDHLNSGGGRPAFDGALVAGAAGGCRDLKTGKGKTCPGALAGGGKIIVLSTQTDVEWGGDAERAQGPDYRVFEIAGVSHIPASAADFRQHGMPDQNPVDFGPFFRAALVNMQAWLNGVEPPESTYIELSDAPARDLGGDPVKPSALDGDGNAKGGVRPPHMHAITEAGQVVGAPLGTYTGFAWPYEKSNFFFLISGTFTPFPAERLKALYPDRESYVSAVKGAADDLVKKRLILREDAAAYVGVAKTESIAN